jgi:hypothetical protein
VKGGLHRLRKKKEPAVLVPPESAAPRDHNHIAGILRLEDESWRLPEALTEVGETEGNGLAPGRVVIVITTLAIIFIAIIAWFVSRMPGN